jgi:hypothetical protein
VQAPRGIRVTSIPTVRAAAISGTHLLLHLREVLACHIGSGNGHRTLCVDGLESLVFLLSSLLQMDLYALGARKASSVCRGVDDCKCPA